MMVLTRSPCRYVIVVPLSSTTGTEILELVQVDVPDLSVIDRDVIRTMKALIVLVRGFFWIGKTFKLPMNFSVSMPPKRMDPLKVSLLSRYKLYALNLDICYLR